MSDYEITWGGVALIEFLVAERHNIGKKFKTALDIGSGEGTHTAILRDAGLKVFQVDKYSKVAEYKVDFVEHKFNKKFDVVFCSHVIEHQRNVGLFLDKIYDVLSGDGVLIIIAPNHPAETLIEGHLNSFIFPLFVQQLIHAGFDCRSGKYLSSIENSFIVSKAKDFELSERQENGYQWTQKHRYRSLIGLKNGAVNVWFHNCQHIREDLSLSLPRHYWPYGIDIRMPRWGYNFRI